MEQQQAIDIATSFAGNHFEGAVDLVSAYPGVELDDNDKDRRIWNVVFKAAGASGDDPRQELWVIVDAGSKQARHFQSL